MISLIQQSSTHEYYQILFNNTYDAIFIESLDGRILDANPSACALLGYTKEELLAMNINQLVPSQAIKMPIEEFIQQELDTNGRSFLGYNIHKSGKLIPVEIRVTSFTYNDEELMLVTVRDISTRHSAELQLARQRELLLLLHEMSVNLIGQKTELEIVSTVLHHACEMFQAKNGFGYALSADPDYVEIKASYGLAMRYLGLKLKIGDGAVGRVWLSGKPLLVENYHQWEGRIQDDYMQNTNTVLALPIIVRGKVRWALGIEYPEMEGKFSAADMEVFEQIAKITSLAIGNVILLEYIRSRDQQFYSLFHNMAEGVVLHKRVKDADAEFNYRITDVNPGFEKITGLKKENVIGKLAGDIFPASIPAYSREITRVLTGKTAKSFEIYSQATHKHFSVSVVPWKDRAFAAIFADITKRKKFEKQLKQLSYRDGLTGLYNRTYFMEELNRAERRSSGIVALMMMDVDGLKLINDTFGHEAGDYLLINVADILKGIFRKEDIVCRIGGDEYAVILYNITPQRIDDIYRRIAQEIEKLNVEEQSSLPIHVSIGHASSDNPAERVDDLFRIADTMMYRNKLNFKLSKSGAIVQTLKQMLAERDYLTEGHGERLQDMMERLAMPLNKAVSDINDLKLFAQFHDIGKIGVSDSILNKNGPLTDEERVMMQQHSEIGHRIAQSSKELLPIADWILKHHEWWNGKGYPLGLKGQAIPLECRMLAIVDAYDAMTSDRPYRLGMSPEAAIEEIVCHAGTQFDPELVDIFVRTFAAEKLET